MESYQHYAGTEESGFSLIGNARGYVYYYDVGGNIRGKEDLTTGTLTIYEYDSLNQLIRENDEKRGVTILYTYDNSGNLLQKDIYSYTTGTPTNLKESISYGYNASAWKDLLTSYNGKTITYDGLGNPITYYNGARFVWRQGRQLTSLTYNGKSISYQYNENGIRIGKKVGTKQTTYFVDAAGTIQALESGGEKLIFFYDSTGRREGFSYYDCDQFVGHFYYLYNAQGDVTNILDENMQVIVNYEYDSWGKVLSCEGDAADVLGVLNPFRYRGYVYDEETGFYYLNSRYYDPETGRFLNADGYVSTGQGLLGYNMFAYCLNNPVNMADLSGYRAKWLNGYATDSNRNVMKNEIDTTLENIETITSSTETLIRTAANETSNSLPTEGEPGTSRTLNNPDGTPKQKRWYGPDGKAERDRDYNHTGNMPFPHDHEWNNGKRGKEHLAPSPDYEFSLKPTHGVALVGLCTIAFVVAATIKVTGGGNGKVMAFQ